MDVVPIPQLQDNYAYLIIDRASGEAAVVDCAEAAPVLDEVKKQLDVPAGFPVKADLKDVTSSVQAELTKSFSSAADTASRYPPSVQQTIISSAKTAFEKGDQWAYLAGIIAVLAGATLVFFAFPRKGEEKRLLAEYHAQDASPG